MKVLLDTHAFIWWDTNSARLSRNVFNVCQDPANTVLVSVATVWEVQIKKQAGKLTLRLPLPDLLFDEQQRNGIQVLQIATEPVLALDQLPLHHKDPFDRMLLAQATAEGAVLASHDSVFSQYSAPVIW